MHTLNADFKCKVPYESIANHSHPDLHLFVMESLVFFLALSFEVYAQTGHHHHAEKAHAHGAGQISIAFDGLKGTLQFESPADSTVGFESQPKTELQKSQLEKTLQKLKTEMPSLVRFDPKLKCVMTSQKVEFKLAPKSAHAETIAEFDILCETSPLGSEILIHFSEAFPRLKKIDIQILVDDFQKSFQTGSKANRFELK